MKVDRWYDRRTRSWVVQTLDGEGNQVGDAYYTGVKSDAIHTQRAMEADLAKFTVHFTNFNQTSEGFATSEAAIEHAKSVCFEASIWQGERQVATFSPITGVALK